MSEKSVTILFLCNVLILVLDIAIHGQHKSSSSISYVEINSTIPLRYLMLQFYKFTAKYFILFFIVNQYKLNILCNVEHQFSNTL